jgi:hypothetical protein
MPGISIGDWRFAARGQQVHAVEQKNAAARELISPEKTLWQTPDGAATRGGAGVSISLKTQCCAS